MSTPSVIPQATTEHIAPAERIHYWEDYNRKALVTLPCTSYSEQGLLATADQHRAGRTASRRDSRQRPHHRAQPPDDQVGAQGLRLRVSPAQRRGGVPARERLPRGHAGELFVFDTRRPYLFGFSSSMRQIQVDVPRDLFTQTCVGGGLPGPMLFGRGAAREGALVAALSSRLGRLPVHGAPHGPADAEATVLDLLRQLAEERTGGRPAPDAYRSQLILAEGYVDRHLHDPGLGPTRVADFMGISVRHLGRIFESTGRTPARHIMERRVVRAHQELTGPGARETRITDVAHRRGFSSQAHFARLVRSRFGTTPSEARAEATRQRTAPGE